MDEERRAIALEWACRSMPIGGAVSTEMLLARADLFALFIATGALGSVGETPRPGRGQRGQGTRPQ